MSIIQKVLIITVVKKGKGRVEGRTEGRNGKKRVGMLMDPNQYSRICPWIIRTFV
jgi:hypothetical protein